MRRSRFGRRRAEQPREVVQFLGGEVGYRPVAHSVFRPMNDVVTTDCARRSSQVQTTLSRHLSEADKMLLVSVDQRRNRRLADDVEASANQWEILLREVDNTRRFRDA